MLGWAGTPETLTLSEMISSADGKDPASRLSYGIIGLWTAGQVRNLN